MARSSHARSLGLIAAVRDLQRRAAERAVNAARTMCDVRKRELVRADDVLGSAVEAWMAGMAAGRFDPLMASARGAEILTSEAALSTAQSALNEAQDVEASALAASRLASARSDVACVEAKRARRREVRAAEERWLLAVGERRAAERAE